MAYTKQTWTTGETITADKLNHMEDGITGGASLESTTYAELIAKRNSGTLTPGMQYRITDYVCTTTQAESRAVSHPFDIIVVADDESTLNENARACLHEGDNYYSAEGHQANLEAWEVKYCIDNDTNRFAWADTENGKGVIFWMKDERGNECPYDFKQIQFKRYKITECSVESLVGKYTVSEHDEAITAIDENNPVWCYTFSFYDPEAEEIVFEDASIKAMDDSIGCIVFNNIIYPYYNYLNLEEHTGEYAHLNNNVITVSSGGYCNSNTFGSNCYYNTFGDNCISNTFGYNCNYNTFGSNCYYNTFGNDYISNTFGNNCYSNTFGSNCSSNTFGYNCYYNTFGNDCYHNTINTTNTRYYHVLDSVGNAQLTTTANNNCATYIGLNSSGVLKTWVPADLVQ